MKYLSINLAKKYDKRLPLRVGTLGPNGTSSEQAAMHFLEKTSVPKNKKNIILYDTFNEVLEALVKNKITLAIVPNAYDRVNEFYINPNTELVELFVHDTPPYGLVKRKKEKIPVETCKIATHPAPIKLVDLFINKLRKKPHNYNVQLVNSTSMAAKMVKDGSADLAITNEIAARNYELEMVALYGKIKMSWSVFVKRMEKSL
jgi:bacilysin biosynthesis protein BacA